jgi:glycerophosphoryl diester phosphodiesterase
VNLRHPGDRPLVIGHRGAAAVAPENTLEGLEAAVAAGADLVEFDVADGLVLEHPGGAPAEAPPGLDDALAYLARQKIGVHIDLKREGIEPEVATAVRRHGLGDRVIVSSTKMAALRRLAGADPGLTRAISYPHDRYGAARLPWPRGAVRSGAAACLRPVMRLRLPPLLAAARAQVLSVRHELVGRALVDAAHARGAALVAWTANDGLEIERLADAGVDAIVTDDPGMALRVLATLDLP